MSDDLETLDTPDVELDAVQQDDAGEGNSEAEVKEQEPFLKVNDRSVYRTREDAIKAYDESGKRIASLSRWEKEAKAYGLDDPAQLKAVADELLRLRELTTKKPEPAKPDDSKLTPEQKAAKEWLKKEAAELGYLSKEEAETQLKELREQLKSLTSASTASEEQRFRNQEAEARGNLSSWLSEAKLEDKDGTKAKVVGTLVKDWINSDEELIGRWRQGGVEARNLVREGFDLALKSLGWQPIATSSSNYAADKARSVAANKKLPAPGTAAKKGDGAKPSGRAVDPMAALHEKAYALFDNMRNSKA